MPSYFKDETTRKFSHQQKENLTNRQHSQEVETMSPTEEEIKGVIMSLKNKNLGHKEISAEALQMSGDCIVKRLKRLIKRIRHEKEFLKEWNTAILCPIHTIGVTTNCGNYTLCKEF